MAERISASSAANHVNRLLNTSLNRRDVMRHAVTGSKVVSGVLAYGMVGAGITHRDMIINDFLKEGLPGDEFLKNAEAIPPDELAKLLAEHEEERLGFEGEERSSDYLFQGDFYGTNGPLYLRIPGIMRRDPRLTVLDILVGDQYIRTGMVSSPHPQDKTIILGPLPYNDKHPETHAVRIFQADTTEDHEIEPDELQPQLWMPTNFTLRTLVDSVTPFTVPRRGNRVWDDCLLQRVAIPHRQDGNVRILGRKIASAENSRYEGLYDDHGRTYDDDWDTKIEVTPDSEIVQMFISRYDHKTKPYNSDYFAFGTHPVIEDYTENGMVRPAQNFNLMVPHNADQPVIMSMEEWKLRKKYGVVDDEFQEVSFDELQREGHDKETVGELIVDFRNRNRHKQVLK